jgi:hypothetical protein
MIPLGYLRLNTEGDIIMGWLFTANATRQSIIDGLIKHETNEHVSWETLRHCTRGNVLWSVVKVTNRNEGITKIIIGCHLLEKSVEKYGQRKVISWGYKSMDESMYPSYYTCPLSYLKEAPVACEEWRDKVKQYYRKYNIGDRLILEHCKIPHLNIFSTKPLLGTYQGARYRVPRDLVVRVETVVTA